jgi:hypothetical protein
LPSFSEIYTIARFVRRNGCQHAREIVTTISTSDPSQQV